MVDFSKLPEFIKVNREKRLFKEKKDKKYLKLHPICLVKLTPYQRMIGIESKCIQKADEVLEVVVEDKIFKSVVCDFHAYKMLSFDNKDILRMIDKKEIEGEWIDK